MQSSNSTRRESGGASHKAQEPALICSIQLCQDVQEEANRSAGGGVTVIKLDGVCQGLHAPLLASAAHHGLNLILKEAFERVQWEDLIEARPACVLRSSADPKQKRQKIACRGQRGRRSNN